MNLAFAPSTLTTGCRPMVLVTTPPQPASNARRMLLSDSVGGADERRNGFSNLSPVKTTDLAGMARGPLLGTSRTSRRRGQAQDATRPWAEGYGATGLRW